jgi:RNA polymerase sigma-70 factor (ECF subfamily)
MSEDFSRPADSEIISRVLDGDVDCFEHLIGRYKGYVFGIVLKHVPPEESEEVAHQCFIKAYKSLPGYKGKSDFRHWLARIAPRTCYDFWRSRYRRAEVPMSALSEAQQDWLEQAVSDESEQSCERAAEAAEAREVLDMALAGLSAEDRMVVQLVNMEERSVKEAADLLGWSRAKVKVRAFRARRRLAGILDAILEAGGDRHAR